MVCFHGRSIVPRPYYVRLLLELPSAQSPFARARCPVHAMMSRTMSAGITPPSSLLRAHAPVLNPPAASVVPSDSGSMQVAVSPCWEKDLPDVISAHLSLRAWTPTPVALEVLVPVSSLKTSAFPSFGPGRRSTMSVQRLQHGALFEAAVIR